MKKINLKILVWEEGKNWLAECLNVEVCSFGKTKKHAIEMIKEALELYFEDNNVSLISEVRYPEIVSLKISI